MKTLLFTTLFIWASVSIAQQCESVSIAGPFALDEPSPIVNPNNAELDSVAIGDSIMFVVEFKIQNCDSINYFYNQSSEMVQASIKDYNYVVTYDIERAKNERLCGFVYNSYFSCEPYDNATILLKVKAPDKVGSYFFMSKSYSSALQYTVYDPLVTNLPEPVNKSKTSFIVYDMFGNIAYKGNQEDYANTLQKGKLYIVKTTYSDNTFSTRKVMLH